MTSTNPMAPEAPDHLINEASIHASLFRTTNIDRELELSSRFGLRQRLIDPAHVHLGPEGESIAMWRDANRTADEIRRFSRKDAAAWLELSEIIAAATSMGLPMMQTNPIKPDRKNVIEALRAVGRGRKHLGEIIRWVSISQKEAIEERFEHPMVRGPLTVNLPFMHFDADASGWALIYLGVLQKWGVAMFEGGTGAFPASLIRCLEAHGGRIRLAAPVEELIVDGGRVTGVRLDGGEELHASRAVMTACGPSIVLNKMLPSGTLPERLEKRAQGIPTTSTRYGNCKVNVALKGKVSLPKHQEWRKQNLPGDPVNLRLPCVTWSTHEQSLEAGEACVRGEVPQMIPGLSQVTTEFDPKMAPEGHDTWWFWSGLVPARPNESWDVVREKMTERILSDSAPYYEGLDELEIAHRALTPHDLEERFGAPDGNVYHVDPIITRFGPMRPAIGLGGYETPVPGLFLSGSGTHPIAGINGMPGMNAAKTAIKVLRKETSGKAPAPRPSSAEGNGAIGEHRRIALDATRSDVKSLLALPDRDLDRLAGVDDAREARGEGLDAGGLALEDAVDHRLADDAEAAEAVQNGALEAGLLRELGIRVKRVLVPGHPVDQRLLRQRRAFLDQVRLAVGRLRPLGGGPVGATEAALADEKGGEAVGEQGPVVIGGAGHGLDHDQGSLALVEDLGDRGASSNGPLRGERLVDLELLLAVEQLGEAHLHPRRPEQLEEDAERGEHRIARQDLRLGLQQVGELGGVVGRHSGADAQVVERDVVRRPRGRGLGQLRAQHLVDVDRHRPSLTKDGQTVRTNRASLHK